MNKESIAKEAIKLEEKSNEEKVSMKEIRIKPLMEEKKEELVNKGFLEIPLTKNQLIIKPSKEKCKDDNQEKEFEIGRA